MKEGRSKVVFKRLIRHKGFLKIHLEHRPTNVMQILGSWPSGSFCLTTKRTLILIFLVVLWIHICWLKTTFCCLNPFFNWVILVYLVGAFQDSYQVDVHYKFWGWGWQFAMRFLYKQNCSEFHMTNKEALEFDLHV